MSAREEIVLRLYNEGWREGAFDVVFELVDPGIVWTAIEGAPDAGTYRGHEGVRGYMQDWLDDFDLGGWRIEESIEVGDRLVCVQRAEATGKGSGVASDIHYACVYRFGEDGRIVELSEFATRDAALEAAGRAS
ncbi:MAG TPA: nuclear transport factor 2 family protein [Thermoleophilaceae bacterium]|nr:nuclear transport factor 2 family protein [Thermoleophilaceae bacterium]